MSGEGGRKEMREEGIRGGALRNAGRELAQNFL